MRRPIIKVHRVIFTTRAVFHGGPQRRRLVVHTRISRLVLPQVKKQKPKALRVPLLQRRGCQLRVGPGRSKIEIAFRPIRNWLSADKCKRPLVANTPKNRMSQHLAEALARLPGARRCCSRRESGDDYLLIRVVSRLERAGPERKLAKNNAFLPKQKQMWLAYA